MSGRAVLIRRKAILEALARCPGMTLREIADSLATLWVPHSDPTVRNDLDYLVRTGKIRRCLGREIGASLAGGEPIAWELRKEEK